jgi:hypothetical protein
MNSCPSKKGRVLDAFSKCPRGLHMQVFDAAFLPPFLERFWIKCCVSDLFIPAVKAATDDGDDLSRITRIHGREGERTGLGTPGTTGFGEGSLSRMARRGDVDLLAAGERVDDVAEHRIGGVAYG